MLSQHDENRGIRSSVEYHEENRGIRSSMEYGLDFWEQIFYDGTTELNQLHSEYMWDFSNLQAAFQEGGVLHAASNVYLFSSIELQLLSYQGQLKGTTLPVVVAIASPFPPSNKVGINTMERSEIIDMEHLRMDWNPYTPLGNRGSLSGNHEPRIFILRCVDRSTGLRNLKHINSVLNIFDCLPYFANPFKEDEREKATYVDILYSVEPYPVFAEFDWEKDDLEEFTNELIATADLPEDHKDAFKEYVRGKVEEVKRANNEARVKRETTQGELSQEEAAAFENMRFYKFYPVATPDTPCVDAWSKTPIINSYYGKAHQLL